MFDPRTHDPRQPGFRAALERRFERMARVLCRRPKGILALSLLGILALSSGGSRLALDTTPEGMLHESDPARMAYDAFREEFGHDGLVVVGIPTPETLDAAFVDRLDALHTDLETVPHAREVTSLIDARYTRGEEAEFVVGELLEGWERRGGDAASLHRFATRHPLYRDNLISANGRLAALVLETEPPTTGAQGDADVLAGFEDDRPQAGRRGLSSAEIAELVAAVRHVVGSHRTEGFEPVVSGAPVLVEAYDSGTIRDSTLCGTASLIAILATLALFFRRVSGVLLPNLVVTSSLSATFGLMGFLGAPYTLSTTGIIPILIAVGVCSAVHVLAIFYRRFEQEGDKEASIVHALGHAGPAIVMTSLTTAAGLFSFALADLASTADMGRYASAGVLLCLIMTVVVLPAVLAVAPIRRHVKSPANSETVDRMLVGLAHLSTRHDRPILVGALLVCIVGLYGTTQLRFSHDPVSYFDESASVRRDLAVIDRELRGGTTLEVVVDSGRENGLYDPALLRSLDGATRELLAKPHAGLSVSQVFSVNDIVKETHQALHGNDPSFYEIPEDRDVLSQELFLFENSGSDDLDRLVDSAYQQARLSIKTPHADAVVYVGFVDEVRRLFDEHLGGRGEVTLTGGMALEAQAVPRALSSMTESYVVAFLVISVLMVVFLGVRLGVVSMIPNLLPIVATMGMMGLLDIPIDLTTITVGSIGLGLVVDDTIHFLYNFDKYYRRTPDVTRAVSASFLGAGRAMVVTSMVLVACFWVDLLASLSNVVRFGVTVGVIVILALLADFLVAPALMRHLTRRPLLGAASRPVARVATLLVLVVALAPARPAEAEEQPDARSIMERVEQRDDGEQAVTEMHMTLVDARGRVRERHARSYARDREDGTDSILFFLEPADMRNTGFLTLDHEDPARSDDQWLFLPALGRSKRISSTEKRRSFLGSDFTYADMTRRSSRRYDYELMGEREVGGHPTWQIDARPNEAAELEETGYARSVLFVRQDIHVVVRAVHWLEGSDRLKYLDVKRIEKVDGIWTPLELHMTTKRGREVEHRTVLRVLDVQYDQTVPETTFTTRRLERGL